MWAFSVGKQARQSCWTPLPRDKGGGRLWAFKRGLPGHNGRSISKEFPLPLLLSAESPGDRDVYARRVTASPHTVKIRGRCVQVFVVSGSCLPSHSLD